MDLYRITTRLRTSIWPSGTLLYPDNPMEKNVGGSDRLARFVFGPLLVLFAGEVYLEYVTIAGLLGAGAIWIGLLVGLVFLVTATTRKCPLNAVLGFNTYRGENAGASTGEDETIRTGRPS